MKDKAQWLCQINLSQMNYIHGPDFQILLSLWVFGFATLESRSDLSEVSLPYFFIFFSLFQFKGNFILTLSCTCAGTFSLKEILLTLISCFPSLLFVDC